MATCKDIHPKDKVLIESFSNVSRKIEEVKIVVESAKKVFEDWVNFND